ncbi:hypothetical protein NJG17_11755 [Stenotrophomonas maltophilia]|uniref:hypothetical protein n=1 Tax=Stenotrophomonas maltophilia TaxID=40324 RepID=UPI00209AE5E6|nr:hypothetical protein [Stenotrophomonas maltophilia]MCO7500576.1 hypothetical protein [Stenotrophomonas maltophilia]
MGPHDVYYTPAAYTAEQMRDYARAALSAQPSPGGQDALDCIGRIEEAIEFRVPHDIYAAVHGELAELKAVLAARQPVRIYGCCAQQEGELHTAECPNMRHLAARQPVGHVPAGFVLVPEKFGIPADVWEGVEFVIGGPGTGEGEAYLDSTVWIGDLMQDDGSSIYGLHLSCDECPEEGSVTLAEFPAAPAQAVDLGQFRQPVQDWLDDAQASMEEHGDSDGVFGYAIEEGTRLLALIDSQDRPNG